MKALGDSLPPAYKRYSWALPAWKYISRDEGPDHWWSDLDEHRSWLESEIEGVLDEFGPAINIATNDENERIAPPTSS